MLPYFKLTICYSRQCPHPFNRYVYKLHAQSTDQLDSNKVAMYEIFLFKCVRAFTFSLHIYKFNLFVLICIHSRIIKFLQLHQFVDSPLMTKF
jgi:hypothetical protein